MTTTPCLAGPPLIGIDVDGVVADLVTPLLEEVSQRTGLCFTAEDIVDFNVEAVLGPEGWRAAREVLSSHGFAASLPAYPGAIQGVRKLQQVARVAFVTSPYPESQTWAFDRTNWLAHHFGVSNADIVHTEDKTLFGGELLVEDAPVHLGAWVRTGRVAIRVVRPWNHGAPGLVAHGWEDIVETVRTHLASGTLPG